MEKSFQMAAKYIPTNQEGTKNAAAPAIAAGRVSEKVEAAEKSVTQTVMPVSERTVTVLQAGMSDAEFIETYSKDRNTGFHTVTAETGGIIRNTVLACVLADQTVMDGESVRFRLAEPMRVGKTLIPFNTQLTVQAKIQGERLQIIVSSMEYSGSIIPVEITVYDTDGQKGIFIPNIEELNAVKEIAANMGTNAGTSINLSNDAGKQFVADMGRNVIQGASQYFSKKMRQVKVHLKAGYKVFLVAPSNSTRGGELTQNI
jgi:conjugative transposon TraM protein